jgi:succinate-semialdehyde dehydrogenase / glutarate-semialdehyde dehydrogenase
LQALPVVSEKGNDVKSINPTNGKLLHEYPDYSRNEVLDIIESVHQGFLTWRRTSYEERSALLRKIGNVLRQRSAPSATLMAEEMGKPVSAGVAEVEKCAWVCDFYAEKGEAFLADEVVATDATKSFVTFQPLGIVLAVMPWNFPFWQVFRFLAPALMAGNVGLLKHASNVSGCALAIEEVLRDAGAPANIFRTLLVASDQVATIIENPHVAAVTLTGSSAAGRSVAAKAGAMLKKSVLELGGSDPYIILSDAGLDAAVPICVSSRLINSGQSCIAAKRFIVVKSLLKEFEERFVDVMSHVTVGNPLNNVTMVGPQARRDLRDELHRQVASSIERGARCLLGGTVPDGPGAFYPPTVLTDVSRGMPAYEEELFGPVAAIIPVQNDDEAIAVANDSSFGLGAAVFTQDRARGEKLAAREIEAGNCFVNSLVKSDPRIPFGGIKTSGYGRELGLFGIREFVNIKTVYIR